jgi:ferredoxin-NADP reductase
MAKITLTLQEKKELAERTMAFRFGIDGQSFVFKPGQCIRITLLDPLYKDKKGNARDFSIASSPGDPSLMIATRMTGSAFKRSLADLPLGSKVRVDGPYGDFLLDADLKRPAIFLAGGIGITPFRSMIKHAIEQHSPQRLTLVYCNRTPDDATFLDEFQNWEKENSNLHLIATMTQTGNLAKTGTGRSGYIDVRFIKDYLRDQEQPVSHVAGPSPDKVWTGRRGYVDVQFVKDHLLKQMHSVFYVAGPPRFVSAVADVLAIAGVNKGDIRTDEFFGYEA